MDELRRMIKRTRSKLDLQKDVLDGFVADVKDIKRGGAGRTTTSGSSSMKALPQPVKAMHPAVAAGGRAAPLHGVAVALPSSSSSSSSTARALCDSGAQGAGVLATITHG